jgi:hypothetical protein
VKVQAAEFDIDVICKRRPTKNFGPAGWYWQEVHLPPAGPFGDVGTTLGDLAAKIESGELGVALNAHQVARGALDQEQTV